MISCVMISGGPGLALASFDGERGIADGQFCVALALCLGLGAFEHQLLGGLAYQNPM